MSLDFEKLENAVVRNGKVVARCPACAESGDDTAGDHLWIDEEGLGAYSCVANQGPSGHAHRQRVWALVGLASQTAKAPAVTRVIPKINAVESKPAVIPIFPALTRPTDDTLDTIRDLRNWPSKAGLELLVSRGLLWDTDVYDNGSLWPAWLITDSSRINAQVRTYDGSPWKGIGGKKAKSLPGSKASWPIGAPDIGDRPNVILCEGQPDFCAALLVAWFENKDLVDLAAPVCITGAGNSLHPEALHYFMGKNVRIVAHNDPAGQGQEAAKRWGKQLYGASAATVDMINFATIGVTKRDGSSLKDLADYATLLEVEDSPKTELFADWLRML